MALSESPRLGFDPFAELRRMQGEMNRVFSGFNATAARDFPPINIWLGEHSVVLTAELPGVTRDDVNLSLQEDVLTLAGKSKTSIGSAANVLTALSRVRSSFHSVSIPTRSRHASTTASWKSNCSGWKRIGRRRSKSALLDPRKGVQSWPRKSEP